VKTSQQNMYKPYPTDAVMIDVSILVNSTSKKGETKTIASTSTGISKKIFGATFESSLGRSFGVGSTLISRSI
jgi:hypothetical protein